MLAPDAFQGVMTDTQIELADQSACSEGGQGFAEFHELCLDGGGSFVRLPMTGARLFAQAGRAVLLIAAQPLADGGDRGTEKPRGGLDAALLEALHEPQPMVIGVFHLTHQIEIFRIAKHSAAILPADAGTGSCGKAAATATITIHLLP